MGNGLGIVRVRLAVPALLAALAGPATAQDCRWQVVACTLPDAFDAREDTAAPFAAVRLPDLWEDGAGGPTANYRLEVSGAVVLTRWPGRGMFGNHDAAAEDTGRAFAVLPPAVVRALPPDFVLAYDSSIFAYGVYEPPSGVAFHPDSHRDPVFEESLLHEIGHVLDARMGFVSERPSWKAARAKDLGRFVSDLAETTGAEDFAESFVAWAAYRRDLARRGSERRLTTRQRDHLQVKIRYRMAWFDRELMAAASTPNGRLFLPR